MRHLSNDYEDHPNWHEDHHKLCDEAGHEPVLSLTESQWKLKKQRIRISKWREVHGRTSASGKRNK